MPDAPWEKNQQPPIQCRGTMLECSKTTPYGTSEDSIHINQARLVVCKVMWTCTLLFNILNCISIIVVSKVVDSAEGWWNSNFCFLLILQSLRRIWMDTILLRLKAFFIFWLSMCTSHAWLSHVVNSCLIKQFLNQTSFHVDLIVLCHIMNKSLWISKW